MKTNPNDPVATIVSESLGQTICDGITKREQFAMAAMQGLASLDNGAMLENGNRTFCPCTIANIAVQFADGLIAALNKEVQNGL